MAQRYIALLGGINTGGHRIKMEDLRALFERLGFSSVATFIASGNVIFETTTGKPAALEAQIEKHLEESLGYRVPTFLRTPEELAEVAGRQPFPDIQGSQSLSVMFLATPLPEEAQRTFLTFRTPVDEFEVHGREIYWLCRGKITESQVDWKRLGKAIEMPAVTVRNITTVRKLAERYTSSTP